MTDIIIIIGCKVNMHCQVPFKYHKEIMPFYQTERIPTNDIEN